MPICKRCEKNYGYLSRNRYCIRCSREVQVVAIRQMRNKHGPIYDKYLEGLRRYEASKPHEEDMENCHPCTYDVERDGNNFCTLRADLVAEFAKEHLDFPENFKILNNWFMGLKRCEHYKEEATG